MRICKDICRGKDKLISVFEWVVESWCVGASLVRDTKNRLPLAPRQSVAKLGQVRWGADSKCIKKFINVGGGLKFKSNTGKFILCIQIFEQKQVNLRHCEKKYRRVPGDKLRPWRQYHHSPPLSLSLSAFTFSLLSSSLQNRFLLRRLALSLFLLFFISGRTEHHWRCSLQNGRV